MARKPRHIAVGKMYEMVFCGKDGIPLPCTEYMNLLVVSRLAKVLEQRGLTLCPTWKCQATAREGANLRDWWQACRQAGVESLRLL